MSQSLSKSRSNSKSTNIKQVSRKFESDNESSKLCNKYSKAYTDLLSNRDQILAENRKLKIRVEDLDFARYESEAGNDAVESELATAKCELNELKRNSLRLGDADSMRESMRESIRESVRESVRISVLEEFQGKIEKLTQALKRVELEKNLMESELGEVKSRLLKNKTNANEEVLIVVQN